MVFTQRPLSFGKSFGYERRNASVTLYSDGDSGTPSFSVQATNLWYDIRDTYIVRFVADGCRKNLPLSGRNHLELIPPKSVAQLFAAAGWSAGRSVAVDAAPEHPAFGVLRQFSGLRVGTAGTGETCASSDIAFRKLAIEPDDTEIADWCRLLGTTLIGIGDVHNTHGELWLASDGRFFGRSLIHDAFYFEGATFGEAMERLLLGRRSRPLIHPSQDSVTLYGDEYTRDHPEIYAY